MLHYVSSVLEDSVSELLKNLSDICTTCGARLGVYDHRFLKRLGFRIWL